MKKTYFYAYLLFTLFFVFRALIVGQEIAYYYDFTSLSLVFVPSLFLYLSIKNNKQRFYYTIIISLISGMFGLVLGLFLTFINVYEAISIFAGIGVSILPLLYSFLLSMILFPLHVRSMSEQE